MNIISQVLNPFKMRAVLFLVFSCLFSLTVFAQMQNVALLKGRIVTKEGKVPVGLKVILPNLKILVATDAEGNFSFNNLPYGSYDLVFGTGIHFDSLRIIVDAPIVDMGNLNVSFTLNLIDNDVDMPTISLSEQEVENPEDGANNQSIYGIIGNSKDLYLNAVAFSFSAFKYQIRGYQSKELPIFLNGILMNDLVSGNPSFGQWAGLNDVFNNRKTVFGLIPNLNGFGGLLGSTIIDASAANQRKQTKIDYSFGNRFYRNSINLSHSTGLLKNGWAVSISLSSRWAKEGYIRGTSNEGYAYYLGISKILSKKSNLDLITFGSPIQQALGSVATQEALDLVGSNYYNPNWGYLNGKIRNAKINTTFQPVALLNYNYKPNNSTKLTIGFAYQSGHSGNSALDWYNAQDPRPDYYKNLPSYYLNNPAYSDPVTAEIVKQEWLQHPEKAQINWERMYATNALNLETVNGITGNRALYVIGEDRNDIQKFNFSTNIQKIIKEHINIAVGLNIAHQEMESYRKLLDLLGGDYFVNLNQFAEMAFVGNDDLRQNDLNNPNQIIKVGDPYQYHYKSKFTDGTLWGQSVFNYKKLDFFVGLKAKLNSFSRNGLYKNGVFQEDSYGSSEIKKFFSYAIKAGGNYKINERNNILLNTSYLTKAPEFNQSFISPRTRNATVQNPKNEQIISIEAAYELNLPKLSGRLTTFFTERKNETQILRYYNESYRTAVNYVMQGIDSRNLGAEFSFKADVSKSFSITGVATWMQHFYTSQPEIDVYLDNDTTNTIGKSKVYWKNYFVGLGPQSAYSLGLNYNLIQRCRFGVNINYVDRAFVSVNPSRLTEEAVGLIVPNSKEWHAILDQEKLPAAYTIDLFLSKPFYPNKHLNWIPKKSVLYLNLGINNVLNNKAIVTSGFQQLRFDYETKNPDRFANKYSYGLGLNYFLNLAFVF